MLGVVAGTAAGLTAVVAVGAAVCHLSKSAGQWIFARLWLKLGDQVDESFHKEKLELFSTGLRGKILEIGSGTGVNIPHYASSEVAHEIESLTLLEPNPHLYTELEKRAAKVGDIPFAIETINDFFPSQATADNQYDVIVCVLVLCSVHDLEATLKEAHRLLKPGGRMLFLEHVCPPRPSLKYFAAVMVSPLWSSVGDGCQLTRETESVIRQLSWREVHIEQYVKDMPPSACGLERLTSCTIKGHAIK
eukprot:m.57335 g.57335  ORF g.57335 m.57335 type:complete len:248 (-) comp13071_c2_seq1:208-951(-)